MPVSENIIDTIKNELTHYESIVFIIHSEAYYKSPICLNEMGAAWILNRKIFSFLTKQFNFCDLTGVINKYDICFKTGNKDSNSILDEIILYIQKAFKLEKINVETLDNIKNKFLAKVSIL